MDSVTSRAANARRDRELRRGWRACSPIPQRPCLRRRSFGEFHFMKLQSGTGSSHDHRDDPPRSSGRSGRRPNPLVSGTGMPSPKTTWREHGDIVEVAAHVDPKVIDDLATWILARSKCLARSK